MNNFAFRPRIINTRVLLVRLFISDTGDGHGRTAAPSGTDGVRVTNFTRPSDGQAIGQASRTSLPSIGTAPELSKRYRHDVPWHGPTVVCSSRYGTENARSLYVPTGFVFVYPKEVFHRQRDCGTYDIRIEYKYIQVSSRPDHERFGSPVRRSAHYW